MLSDMERIQGLWRVTSHIFQGRPVSGASHYLFDEKQVKAIYPQLVDGGVWQTFELDPLIQPKRFTNTLEVKGKDEKAVPLVHRWLYDLDGDTLRLCLPNVFGNYPDVISDQIHTVVTLARDTGPLPETKRPSGKTPIDTPDIGRLTWKDNHDWWQTQLEVMPGLIADVHVKLAEGNDDLAAIDALRDFITWLHSHEQAARKYAAAQLLDTYNECWNENTPITPATFAGLLRLESVGVNPGIGAELFYEDGDLFAGHCIIVSVNEDRTFEDAYIAG